MSNTAFRKTNRPGFSNKDWIYNVLVESDRIIYRALIPSSEIATKIKTFDVGLVIDRDRLLNPDLLFEGLVCNFKNSSLIKASIDSQDYYVIYETVITLEDLKAAGTWHSGALCSVYVPVLNRIWHQPGFYSDATSECWHRDASHGESMDSHEAKYRRLLRVETLANFSVIDDDSTMANSDVVLCVPECKEVITNLCTTEWPENMDMTELMVGYDIECPAMTNPDSVVEVTVRANLKGFFKSINKTVDVKMINGYAAKTKVELVDGIGHFTVRALDLPEGEKVIFQIQDYGRTCAESEIAVV